MRRAEPITSDKSDERLGQATSPEPDAATDVSVFWIKDTDKPVGMLPSDLTPEPYVGLRQKALDQRGRAATGTCPYDMDVLYQFWSHFLIRNYNSSMYAEFKHFAGDDAKTRHSSVGQDSLVKFYDQALNSGNSIPTRVARDYVELVKAEDSNSGGQAFKNLHRAWRNGALNLRNRKRLADLVDEELKRLLES